MIKEVMRYVMVVPECSPCWIISWPIRMNNNILINGFWRHVNSHLDEADDARDHALALEIASLSSCPQTFVRVMIYIFCLFTALGGIYLEAFHLGKLLSFFTAMVYPINCHIFSLVDKIFGRRSEGHAFKPYIPRWHKVEVVWSLNIFRWYLGKTWSSTRCTG